MFEKKGRTMLTERELLATWACEPWDRPPPPPDDIDAESLRRKGNAHFAKGEHAAAEEAYTAALDVLLLVPDDAARGVVLANRSAARLKLGTARARAALP